MDPLWSDGSPIQPVYFRHCLLYCIFNIQMLHSLGFFGFFLHRSTEQFTQPSIVALQIHFCSERNHFEMFGCALYVAIS